MKKVSLIWLIFTIIMFVVSVTRNILAGIEEVNLDINNGIGYGVVILWGLFTITISLGIIIQTIYLKIIIKKMSNEQQISFWISLRNNPKKLFFINLQWSSTPYLGILYLMENKIEEARLNLKMTEKYLSAIYPLFLIAVYDDNKEDIERLYCRLQVIKNKKFNNQKQMSTRIKNMIENKVFDEEVYASARYGIVKDICLRYQKA